MLFRSGKNLIVDSKFTIYLYSNTIFSLFCEAHMVNHEQILMLGNFRNDIYGDYIRYTHASCHSYVVMDKMCIRDRKWACSPAYCSVRTAAVSCIRSETRRTSASRSVISAATTRNARTHKKRIQKASVASAFHTYNQLLVALKQCFCTAFRQVSRLEDHWCLPNRL